MAGDFGTEHDGSGSLEPELIWNGQIADAITFSATSGLDEFAAAMGSWFTAYPGRPDYFTHWGEAFRFAASVIGLPVGDYPRSRPPQGILPEEAKVQIRTAMEKFELAGKVTSSSALALI